MNYKISYKYLRIDDQFIFLAQITLFSKTSLFKESYMIRMMMPFFPSPKSENSSAYIDCLLDISPCD